MKQDTKKQNMDTASITGDLFTIKEITDKLKISRQTFYRLVEKNGIEAVRIGDRSVRFTQGDLNVLMGMPQN